MLSIGAFAQIGQVTHRMLRHWDIYVRAVSDDQNDWVTELQQPVTRA
ncbi:hypothetical protein [Microbacterium alcoholitolerans]